MRELTRRQALAAGAAAGVPLLLCAPAAAAGLAGEAAVLTRLMRVERVSAGVYTAVMTSGSGRVRSIAGRFAAHETEHVQALGTALEAFGAPRPAAPRNAAELDAALLALGLERLTAQRTAAGALDLMLGVEERLIAEWIRAHRGLDTFNLVQTATQVLACQAQHAVVLRDALQRETLPDPLDAGG